MVLGVVMVKYYTVILCCGQAKKYLNTWTHIGKKRKLSPMPRPRVISSLELDQPVCYCNGCEDADPWVTKNFPATCWHCSADNVTPCECARGVPTRICGAPGGWKRAKDLSPKKITTANQRNADVIKKETPPCQDEKYHH